MNELITHFQTGSVEDLISDGQLDKKEKKKKTTTGDFYN